MLSHQLRTKMAAKRPLSLLSNSEWTSSFNFFADFFIPDTNYKTRGNKQKLKIPKLSHVASRTNFFSVRVVPVWNALSDDIILCGSYKQFCKQIVTFDLSPFLKRDWDNVTFCDSF